MFSEPTLFVTLIEKTERLDVDDYEISLELGEVDSNARQLYLEATCPTMGVAWIVLYPEAYIDKHNVVDQNQAREYYLEF